MHLVQLQVFPTRTTPSSIQHPRFFIVIVIHTISNCNNVLYHANKIHHLKLIRDLTFQDYPQKYFHRSIVQMSKQTVKFTWNRMMEELAPKYSSGSYICPSYTFDTTRSLAVFDTTITNKVDGKVGRYHVYLGNPCPWCH